MRKEVFLLIALVLVGSFFFASWSENAEVNMTGYSISESGVRVEKSIIEKVDKNESVRVSIKLKDDDEIENVKKSLEGKVKHTFDDEKVSAVIAKEDLEKLENNSEVDVIDVVGTRSLFLQDSVPLINSTTAWQLQINEINLTGEGETVCVIDTGIDLDHPDLGGCFGANDPDSSCKILGGIDYCADDENCTTTDANPDDAHGHGSHVAGTVAADGSIDGVAPGAKLIIMKAANSTGTFWDDDLEKAIDWCVDNASKFNISVISMSLGGGLFSSHCNSDPLADEINNAVANNISVVIATGNDGSTSQISGPACVENATPVGGSTKADGMYSNGNRNSLVQIIAPGVSINSTIPNDAYTTLTGTSMATPHVSGAIAILNQYLRLEKDSTYTPAQLEDTLNDTGVSIDDSGGSGLVFSRIDVYEAIYSLDDSLNNITLISPSHNSNNELSNVTFSCFAEDTFGLSNITFNLWNNTGGLVNETVKDVTGNYSYSLEINITELDNGTYTWNCKAVDAKGNSNWSSSNFTRRVGNMETSLVSPEDTIHTNTADTNFTCNVNDTVANLSSVTFYLWNSSSRVYNETKSISGNTNSSVFNYTFSVEEDYEWNCYFVDDESNTINNDNYTITYDSTDPVVTLDEPDDDDTTSSTEIDFDYVVVEINPKNCSLIIEGDVNETDTSITNGSNSFNDVEVETGSIDWQVKCYDYAGNMGTSTEWDVTISSSDDDEDDEDDEDDSSDSAASTGSTATPVTYTLGEELLEAGTEKELCAASKINFKVDDGDHSLTIDSVYSSSIKVTVSSTPQTAVIDVGETKKFDLTDDNVYDLMITLNNIISATSKANITVKGISEEIGTREISDTGSGNDSEAGNASDDAESSDSEGLSSKTKATVLIVVLGAAALSGLGFLIYKKKDLLLKKISKIKKGSAPVSPER